MTNPMSPEDHLRARIESQRQEIEQLRADISQAYYLRDKAEGRFCTALGSIEQLHAAVKTAQELAATRLMEIEKLQMRLKRHEPVSLYNGHDIEWWKAEAERLRDALKRVRRVAAEGTTHTGMIAALGILVDRVLNPGNGPLPPDYTYRSDEPSEQRPADGTRDGDGVWQGGLWHPDPPDPLDEWRLMEFAPKDGTRILALVTEVQFYRDTETPNELIPAVVKWTGEYSGWGMPGHGGLRPTLWLPIKLTNDPQDASQKPVATPGATQKSEDSATDESSRPRGLLSQGASRDADHCDYPDCEQHWTHVVAQARAILEPLAEHDPAIRQWLKTPDLPKLDASRDAPGEQPPTDKMRLDWWESQHTLHNSLHLLYVVDGYDLEVIVDDRTVACYHGEDIRACIDAAMKGASRDASSDQDKRCQHDLQVDGNTIVVTDEGTRAVCVYCSQVWQMPPSRTFE